MAIGRAMKVAGYRLIAQEQEAKGIEFYEKAIELLEAHEYFEEAASVYLLLGNLALQKGDLVAANDFFYHGIRDADACDCDLLKSIINTGIARLKVWQGEYEEARKLYDDAMVVQEKNDDIPLKLARTHFNYGALWAKTGKLNDADVYFKKALKIFEEKEAEEELARTLGALGNISLEKQEIEEALIFYKESYEITNSIQDSSSIALANYNIGNYFFEQNNYEAAERYLNNCLDIAVKENIVEIVSQAYAKLSEVKEAINQPHEALDLYKQHIAIQQRIFTTEKEKAILEVGEKYKNEKIQALAKKNLALRNSIIVALILGLMIALGLIGYYYQKRKTAILMAIQKEKIYEQEMLRMQQTAELRALNAAQDGQEQERRRIAEALHNSMGSLLSAIQMHFQTLSETINFQKNDTQILFDKSLQLVQEAAITNRTIAHEMMPPVLMKFGLGAALGGLAEKIKGPNINVATSVYGLQQRLPEKLELSLYRIIDELINNIVKHAKASEVNIQMTVHEDGLNILVEDNGVGFNYEPNVIGYGIGLSSIMTRVNHFKGKFEVDSSEGNGTTIIIDIPDDVYR